MPTRVLSSALLGLMILVGTTSLLIKFKHDGNGVAPALARDLDTLTTFMAQHAYTAQKPQSLNREGSVQALYFEGHGCTGGWLISPMYRNSEAAALFQSKSRHYTTTPGAVFFVLDGTTYEKFPAFELWLSQKIDALKKTVGLKKGSLKPLYAVRAFGDCGTAPFEQKI